MTRPFDLSRVVSDLAEPCARVGDVGGDSQFGQEIGVAVVDGATDRAADRTDERGVGGVDRVWASEASRVPEAFSP